MDYGQTHLNGTGFFPGYDDYVPRRAGKYSNSLKSLKPVRFTSKHAPIDNAGLFSTIVMSWLSEILYKARKEIKFEDLPPISEFDAVASNAPRLQWYYNDERKKKGDHANIGYALFRFARTRYLLAVLMSSVSFVLGLVVPALVVNQLLLYTSAPIRSIGYGIALCFALLVSDTARALTNSASFVIGHRTLLRVRNGLAQVLYRKLIRLKSFNQKSAGEMINYLVNDMQRVVEFMVFGALIVSSPVGIIAGTIYAGFVLGWTGVMGLLGYMVLLPVQAVAVKLGVRYRANSVRLTDRRVRILNEVFNCMKMIKFYAWEGSFAKVIGGIRKKEQGFLVKSAAVQLVISGLIPISPIFVTVLTLLLHTGLGYSLTAAQAFTTMVIFNSMRIAIGVLPIALRAFTEALIAVRRFNELLNMEEIEEYQVEVGDADNAVELINVTASSIGIKEDGAKRGTGEGNVEALSKEKGKEAHGNEKAPLKEVVLLKDINLNIKRGSLIGVCGAVGSGKSSLIAAILGQVRFNEGSVGMKGSVAYVPQQAWVFHDSLRENVLFGMPFDKTKYHRTIAACALQADIDILPNGDLTEIGERGINLSGGQKQRVSLARAVYSDRDIILLDDPLSAVDAHVGKHIFGECIKKQLAGKTVVLVSHQLQYFKQCDTVIMLKDGRIAEQGTFDELMGQSNGFSELIRNFEQQMESKKHSELLAADVNSDEVIDLQQDEATSHPGSAPSSPELKKAASFNLVDKESQEFGAVRWKTYKTFMKAMGGYLLAAFVYFHTFFYLFLGNATSFWITYWINEGGQLVCSNGTSNGTTSPNQTTCVRDPNIVTNPRRGFYQMIYGIILIVALLVLVTRAASFPHFMLRASSRLHRRLFRTIMRCPMAFFDRTPVGRILNRFSKDIDEMDSRLVATLNSTMQLLSLILLSFITICIVFPYFLIACAVFVVLYVLLLNVYRSGIREVKRFENVYRSPWISHVTATVQGLPSIHAYHKGDVFVKTFETYIDAHTVPFQVYYGALWWVGIRLDVFNIGLNFVVALLVVLATSYSNVFGLGDGAALAGLALTYSIQISGILQAMTRFLIESETIFTSVERVREYAELSDLEKPAIVECNRPPKNWPQDGAISFKNVSMRYRENLPEVLRGVTFDIKPKEKIGIAGRTGSGKSSLGVALFRLVELSSGEMHIDDLDIRQMGLDDLRKSMTIIPQDPVLFVGTIRYNLDPFWEYTDEALWLALERSHIKDLINKLPKKLESEVVENGENFSVGERQLLCMARAILRHSKIIMLDEATAAIDSETDSLVQDTIREAFADCTVLTIAHRLHTILNCDKILVMSEGQVAEFGDTQKLVNDPYSRFSLLLAANSKQLSHSAVPPSPNSNNNSNHDVAGYTNPAFSTD